MRPDPAALERLEVLGGPDLLAELAAIFLDHGALRRDQLLAAWAGADLDGVRRAAHSIKGSAGNLGLGELREVAAQVEAQAEAGVDEGLGELVDALSRAFERACQGVQTLM